MAALAASTAWMLSGMALAAGLAWAFLITPESTVFMLALSVILALSVDAVVGVTWSGALLGWTRGWSAASLRRSWRGLVSFAPPAVLVGIVWWIVGAALGWLDAHAGEIAAWCIATFNWSDVRAPMNGLTYAGEWRR
jgi:hypothetical protein